MRRPIRRSSTLVAAALLVLSTVAGAGDALAAGRGGTAARPVSEAGAARVAPVTVKGTRVVSATPRTQSVPHRPFGRISPDWTLPVGRLHALSAPASSPASSPPSGSGPNSPLFTVRQTGFAGLTEADDFPQFGCGGGTPPAQCVEPPDPWIGVGPDHVVQAVNNLIRITDRSGATVQADQPFTAFFNEPADQIVDADPHVIYDAAHGKWLATALSFDCTAGHLYLGVTDGTDPRTGHWTMYQQDFAGQIPDYPGLGWSDDKIVVTVNEFPIVSDGHGSCDADPIGFTGARIEVVDWADATNGGAPPTVTFGGFAADAARFSWRAAQDVTDATSYVIGSDTAGHVHYAQVTGTNAGANLAMTDADLTTTETLDGFFSPSQPIQANGSGTDTIAQAVDFRPTDAVWRSDRLWFVATSGCTDGTRPIACVRLTELDTSAGGAEIQTMYEGSENTDTFMAGIGLGSEPGVPAETALHVVFSAVTPRGFVSTYAAYRYESDALTTIRFWHIIQAGQGTYAGERWGDYVGVATDPTDSTSVWQGDEYPTASGSWGTWISKLTVSPVGTVGIVDRDSGATRYETAVAVSQKTFQPGVAVVYISTGTNFPDALAGGPAAALEHGPLLLVTPSTIPDAVKTELTRLQPKRIAVLGGTGAVSESVRIQLQAYTTGLVTRLSGANRYATAAAVSAAVFSKGVSAVFLATGTNFPDALSGGPAAAFLDSPLLLVTKTAIPSQTATELNRLRPQYIFVLGGTGVITDAVKTAARPYTSSGLASHVIRLSGSDRYHTATAITSSFFFPGQFIPDMEVVYVAVGTNFPDALAGGPAAALEDGALLLVTRDSIPPTTQAELTRLQPRRIVVLGGTGAISNAVQTALQAYVVP